MKRIGEVYWSILETKKWKVFDLIFDLNYLTWIRDLHFSGLIYVLKKNTIYIIMGKKKCKWT